MKDKLNITLLILWAVSTLGCAAGVLYFFDLWWLALLAVPGFCAQLFLCRICGRGWVRALPGAVVTAVWAAACFYFLRDEGWDRLGALLLAFAGAAILTGVAFGWIAFLPRKTGRRNKKEQ